MENDQHINLHKIIEQKSLICRVVDAKYVDGYTIHVKFNDGAEGDVDLSSVINKGGVFNSVKDKNNFKNFAINHGVITWSNSLDIAPERLRDNLL